MMNFVSSRGQGVCLYSSLRWTWAVGSNRHWLNGYPWSFRSVERNPERESWLDSKGGGRPGPGPVLPPLRSRGFWSLLDGRKLRGALISICNPDMWAFLPYFLITPCRTDKQQNSWNSVRSNPNCRCCLHIGTLEPSTNTPILRLLLVLEKRMVKKNILGKTFSSYLQGVVKIHCVP